MADVTHASDLGIDLSDGKPQQLYRWFLASMLFGRPIRQERAAETYHALIEHGFTSPGKFAGAGREQLRGVLDEGGYGRFDYQMTDALHETMRTLDADEGSVSHLVKTAASRKELRERLGQLKGIGPKTIEIFLRDIPDEVLPD
ncbi:DNA methylase [Curtobacterium sp. PhB115]|uniref:DNA methylase n=1 Tax=Curtobacterium sp. PhB115 TaxID=2485173 RepID=UPI000F4CA7E4|nr:DNA methylase [Curtobacterium sp. PhB115]